MATSGSKDYSITAIEIIGGALRKLGAFDHGEAIPAEEVADAMQALNLLTKEWGAYGLDIWVRQEVEQLILPGTPTYTIGQDDKPLELIYAAHRDKGINRDTPLNIIGEVEYQRLALKFQKGRPTNIWFKPQRNNTEIYVWPTGDDTLSASDAANQYIVMQVRKHVDDFNSTTDEPEFPIEWANPLIFNLAHDLAPEYGVDQNKRSEMFIMGQKKLNDLLDNNQENANVVFTLDTQGR